MSRSGRPPLAGGSAVADGKNISKLSRRALASRRAADRAKLLANLAGDRAGCSLLVPLVLHRRPQRRLCHKLAPRDMPCVARRNLLPKRWQSLVPPMDLSALHRQRQIHWHRRPRSTTMTTMTTTMTRLMTAPPVGTNAWSFSAASETPLHLPWPNSSHLLWKLSSNLPTTLV